MRKYEYMIQVDGDSVPKPQQQPEHKLLAAMMIRAIRDVAQGNVEAHRWLLDTEVDDTKCKFSFIGACKHLTLDPDIMRNTILNNPTVVKNKIKGWRK